MARVMGTSLAWAVVHDVDDNLQLEAGYREE
jgi:hypothetical protein